MSISNRKPGDRKEAPAEPLKRSVAGCMRAIARKSDLEVTYASDRPALMGDKARLPEPPRRLTPQDVAVLRGHSDSIALRLACHDPAVHRRLAPEGQAARAVFDAVEQARVESIGSRRMAGMAGNLSAMLEDRYHRGGKYEEITDRADAPLEDALALLVSSPRRRRPRSWISGATTSRRGPAATSTASSRTSSSSATSPARCASS
jgi:cobaltochelatase CobT